MAVAFDLATTSLNINAANKTFSHTVTGANPAIVVFVVLSGQTTTVSTITYAAASLAQIGTDLDFGVAGSIARLIVLGLANCATGANNVVVTLSASNAAWDTVAVSFNGVATSSAFSGFTSVTTVGASAASLSRTVTTGATGDMVVDGTGSTANNATTSTPGTQRWLDNSGATNTRGATTPGGASVTATENWDLSNQNYGMVAFNVVQSVSQATTVSTTWQGVFQRASALLIFIMEAARQVVKTLCL